MSKRMSDRRAEKETGARARQIRRLHQAGILNAFPELNGSGRASSYFDIAEINTIKPCLETAWQLKSGVAEPIGGKLPVLHWHEDVKNFKIEDVARDQHGAARGDAYLVFHAAAKFKIPPAAIAAAIGHDFEEIAIHGVNGGSVVFERDLKLCRENRKPRELPLDVRTKMKFLVGHKEGPQNKGGARTARPLPPVREIGVIAAGG